MSHADSVRTILFRGLLTIVTMAAWRGATAAPPAVELEIILPPQAPPTMAHEWMSALKDLPLARLRLHGGRGDEQPNVRRDSDGPTVSYRVTGILSRNNRLQVPGAVFSRRELRGLGEWLATLDAQFGPPAPERFAFGLPAEQLVDVHRALSERLSEKTRGRKPQELLTLIARDLKLPLRLQTSAQRGFAEGDPVADELVGLSTGTALAAMLRPLGLVLVPRRTAAGGLELAVMGVREAPESWPIGWPAERPVRELVPKFYDFLEVEIDDVPLASVLETVQARLEIPFLWDHNGLLRQRIDPHETLVSFPSRRTFYKKILNHVLHQTQLRSELRVDEAEQPLLWIYPANR